MSKCCVCDKVVASKRKKRQCISCDRTMHWDCQQEQCPNIPKCPICLSLFSKEFVDWKCIKCSATYHLRCFFRWLSINKTCPTCRTPQGGFSVKAFISEEEKATYRKDTTWSLPCVVCRQNLPSFGMACTFCGVYYHNECFQCCYRFQRRCAACNNALIEYTDVASTRVTRSYYER